jgi:hypothetical protein
MDENEIDPLEASWESAEQAPVAEEAKTEETPVAPLEEEKVEENSLPDIVPLEDEEPIVETPQDVDTFLQEKYSDYGIKSGKDLDAFFQKQSAYESQIAELNAKLEDASKKANPFENDAQRKLFEFAKSFDGTNAKVLAEFEHLQSLDVEKMSAKDALKEAYVQANKTFGRAKAEEMFDLNYEDTYDTSALDPDDDAKEIRKRSLKLEFDSVDAKRKLADTIKTFKPEATSEKQAPINTVLEAEVQRTLKNADEVLSNFKTVDIVLDKTGARKFTVGLSENQQNIVNQEVRNYLSNRANYDEKGNLLNGATPQSVAQFITKAAFNDLMIRKAYERGLHEKEMEYVQKNVPKAGKPISAGSNAHQVATSEQEAFEMSLASK